MIASGAKAILNESMNVLRATDAPAYIGAIVNEAAGYSEQAGYTPVDLLSTPEINSVRPASKRCASLGWNTMGPRVEEGWNDKVSFHYHEAFVLSDGCSTSNGCFGGGGRAGGTFTLARNGRAIESLFC